MQEFNLELPCNGEENGTESLRTNNSILFVGANGAGKTRLGAWIELKSPQREKVHRISAQKSLAMPDSTTPVSIELAERNLLFGNPEHENNKEAFRWGRKPATGFLNDYEKLMVYLFSDETESNAQYKVSQKASNERLEPPTTKLDQVKTLWERILPHRELIVGGLRIQTRTKDARSATYNSSEMSDGERVIFYLIGQCLAAPPDGIIVVDEPELHLHKSIQNSLWAAVEDLRNDCLFVYLTHDVDFAASHEGATKVWLKSFDGTHWSWEVIQTSEQLPDELLIEVLGSRRPVVFVEGENGSYDVALYRAILNDFLVIPRGSCVQVIQSVRALISNNQLHHLEVFGIIDRDRRTEEEIAYLQKDQIHVLGVAEVENLFCTREILEVVSRRLQRDSEKDFEVVSSFVLQQLQAEIDNQISMKAISEIRYRLNRFDEKVVGEEAIEKSIHDLVGSIDVQEIYRSCKHEFEGAIREDDYEKVLKLYNRKSISSQVSTKIGLANSSLPELVVRLARGDAADEIKNCLRGYLGSFGERLA